ncbi:MAG: dihydrodipicolinate synthase family protein [Theionarchaea archaeon]|nr:dihydrodipicolinate synthase family protein [Theionarchaea archaeon]
MKTIKNLVTGKEMPEFLTGVIAPMFTPCNEDGSLDEEGIRSYIQWLKGTGAVTSIFVRSGVGKMLLFSMDEVREIARVAIDEAAGDIYVMVGTSGDFSGGKPREDKYIEQTVELSQFAQDQGADGAVVVSFGMDPLGNLDEKVKKFYERLNDSVQIPIIIYQPGMTPAPFLMKPEVLETVSALPNVRGMKFSTDDMKRFGDLCAASLDQDFTMISGAETSFLPALSLGAGGVIGEGCNTYPQVLRAVFDSFMSGDLGAAARAQATVNRTLAVWSGMDSALVGKTYLASKGVKIKPILRRRKVDVDIEPRLDAFEKAIDSAVEPFKKG